MGTHGDVPRERPVGGRGYVRLVADGSAEDVQVRGRRARPESLGAGPAGRAGARAALPAFAAALAAGSAVRGLRGAAESRVLFMGGLRRAAIRGRPGTRG